MQIIIPGKCQTLSNYQEIDQIGSNIWNEFMFKRTFIEIEMKSQIKKINKTSKYKINFAFMEGKKKMNGRNFWCQILLVLKQHVLCFLWKLPATKAQIMFTFLKIKRGL